MKTALLLLIAGGLNDSLNLDMDGKALSFLLLTLEVLVPADALRSPTVLA